MGFLKFLLAIALMVFGFIVAADAFLGAVQSGMQNALFGQHVSSGIFWVIGIIGVVMFLGGIYMLRSRRH